MEDEKYAPPFRNNAGKRIVSTDFGETPNNMERTDRSCRANAAEATASRPSRDQIPRASLHTNAFASLEAFVLKDNNGNVQPLREHSANPSGEMIEIHTRRDGTDSYPPMEKILPQEPHSRNTIADIALVAIRSEVSTPRETTASSPSTLSPSPRKLRRISEPQNGTVHRRLVNSDRRTLSPQFKAMCVSASRHDETRKRRKSADQPRTAVAKRPVVASKVKSIVGSRPTHWGKISPEDTVYSTRHKSHKTRKASLINSRATFDAYNLCTNRKPQQISQRIDRESAAVSTQPGRLSFIPAFASKVEKPRIESSAETIFTRDDSIEGTESLQRDDPLPRSSPVIEVWQPPTLVRSQDPVSSVQRRKSKTATGPLTKRLQYLRQRVSGDAIRLSSGQYPFRVKNDGNDPRNRADSFCDVTVLGLPIPWGIRDTQQQNQDYLVAVWGYVHTTTDVSTAAKEHPVTDGTFVWIVLPHRIAFEQSLAPGSQIRAYDPTFVGFRDESNAERNEGGAECHMLLCKHLCETYPSSLPPLSPDLSFLLKLSER